MKLRTKKGDTLKVKEDEDVVKKISLVEKHESTTIALEIDTNGIYSLIVKSEEDNTFDIKKLYNIPNKLPRYIQDFHATGIDLGTTECFCSVIRHDGPRPVQLDPLKHTYNMPSYIIFDEKKPTCGYIAVDKMKTKAEFIVFDAKRFIGKSFDKIALDSLWPFRVFKDAENALCEVETFYGRERKSPQEISAVLLNRIKTEAEIFEGIELSEVVIGIPSEFSEKRMKATQSAAELAGWQKIHFIPESVAAAFAYCSEIKISNNSNMLIFDFGGGTVDICLAKFKDGHLQILASDGDSFLGGRDYDNILFTHFHGILTHKFGIDFMVQRKKYSLKEICQDIKHTLSANDEAWLNVDDFICDSDDIITITRKEFEDLTSHFLLRIQDVIQRALTKAKISKIDVNYVFRVGGGCRMPMIQKICGRTWGCPLCIFS
uniref:Heat shock protein 70 n=1 Tax=Panagrolaimus superbus TaxID=310955 RepID=A0A914XUY4_9BILA